MFNSEKTKPLNTQPSLPSTERYLLLESRVSRTSAGVLMSDHSRHLFKNSRSLSQGILRAFYRLSATALFENSSIADGIDVPASVVFQTQTEIEFAAHAQQGHDHLRPCNHHAMRHGLG